jgi:dTDP-4-dehydrorhamnose 3,5-epimerase-like enzyme
MQDLTYSEVLSIELAHRHLESHRRRPMIFTEIGIEGAFAVDLERREDSRDFFAGEFCQDEFRAMGLKLLIAQENLAYSCRTA